MIQFLALDTATNNPAVDTSSNAGNNSGGDSSSSSSSSSWHVVSQVVAVSDSTLADGYREDRFIISQFLFKASERHTYYTTHATTTCRSTGMTCCFSPCFSQVSLVYSPLPSPSLPLL